ncbi:acetate--CoA ligase [Halorussus gelatinilyticus]|uniref:acetate--CoA ligase n=1 Tax=Halorussus gelatinilyticus TaxID=2937524 RepID=A0A8U0IM11_9EURY|nr:acetate--CoA ligase [Halorussus gelatinilyticus]UPW02170.1 acetate--CoA ligase [Halorussus gelatinilyticus]
MVDGTPDEREWVDPPESFVAQANVTAADRDAFRAAGWPECWRRAADLLEWDRGFDAVLDGGASAGTDDEGSIRWFPGGRLNAAHNCVDRHVEAGRGDETAVAWEGKLGETRTYTYRELHDEVNAFAAALRELGVGEGDVVTLYLPMIPELPVAMLACARIGAPHSVVFAGFSADALATRLSGAESEFLVTCDGYYRRGAALDLKRRADNACVSVSHSVEQVVVNRLDDGRPAGDCHAYADLVDDHAGATVEPVARESDDLLFLIYTSGTTGEPTLVRHTTGGYLTHVAWTSHAVLDLGPDDTHWCSADVGWITGHSYAVYGPLALGATTVLYEGTPDHPETDRLWEIIERNDVDVFYTAPTSIRAFMKWGEEHPARHDLSSLRLLGSVGEPIDETAWHWYRDHVGDGDCPVVDTWWQTETGGIVLSTLPGADRMRPGAVGKSLPGVETAVVDETGRHADDGEAGQLVVTRPWPGMARSLCEESGWGARRTRRVDGEWQYATGDNAVRDADGYLHLLGRADDVVKVSDRRLSTAEIESAIVGVEGVAEAAVVVGADDEAAHRSEIHAFVSPESNVAGDDALRERVGRAVEEAIGSIAVPDVVTFAPSLPKTRSGKVVRRYLAAIANGEELGDTSALRNPEVVGELESLLDR